MSSSEKETSTGGYRFAWIQCDNNFCMKWRKVREEIAREYAKKNWICKLNHDTTHNACSASQEVINKPKLERFVFSRFEVGQIVWAKMASYAPWPAIVSPDPINGEYYEDDDDGDVNYYHVEYLGNPRTRSWIHAQRVEAYGSGNAPLPNDLSALKTKHSKTYFEGAMMQANECAKLSPAERVKQCRFEYRDATIQRTTPCKEEPVVEKETHTPSNAFSFESGMPTVVLEGTEFAKADSQPAVLTEMGKQQSSGAVYRVMSMMVNGQHSYTLVPLEKPQQEQRMLFAPEPIGLDKEPLQTKMRRLSSQSHCSGSSSSSDRMLYTPEPIQVDKEPLQTKVRRLSTQSCSSTSSSEVAIDTGLELDLKKYFERNGLIWQSDAFRWYGKDISVVLFYQLVMAHGGCYQAIREGNWTLICMKVTGFWKPDCRFSKLLRVYKKYLLPYELKNSEKKEGWLSTSVPSTFGNNDVLPSLSNIGLPCHQPYNIPVLVEKHHSCTDTNNGMPLLSDQRRGPVELENRPCITGIPNLLHKEKYQMERNRPDQTSEYLQRLREMKDISSSLAQVDDSLFEEDYNTDGTGERNSLSNGTQESGISISPESRESRILREIELVNEQINQVLSDEVMQELLN